MFILAGFIFNNEYIFFFLNYTYIAIGTVYRYRYFKSSPSDINNNYQGRLSLIMIREICRTRVNGILVSFNDFDYFR